MEEYQKRVIVERDELHEKVRKLEEFFRSDIYLGLDIVERDLMRMQWHAMEVYLRILNMRLAGFLKGNTLERETRTDLRREGCRPDL